MKREGLSVKDASLKKHKVGCFAHLAESECLADAAILCMRFLILCDCIWVLEDIICQCREKQA